MASSRSYEEILRLNRQSAVKISSWALVGASAVFVLARGATRSKSVRIHAIDILIPLALVLAFIQTACIQVAVDNGLGRSFGTLEARAVAKYYEVTYWAQLLYLLVLGVTKTSYVLLPLPLRPQRTLRVCCYAVSGLLAVATVALMLTTAFQCDLPEPWRVNIRACIDINFLWKSICVVSIATDILVITPPLATIFLMNLNHDIKIASIVLCSFRLLVPVLIGVQLYYVFDVRFSTNPTYDGVPLQIWTQFVLNASIMTVCCPSVCGLFSDKYIATTRSIFSCHAITGNDVVRLTRSVSWSNAEKVKNERVDRGVIESYRLSDFDDAPHSKSQCADRVSWSKFRPSFLTKPASQSPQHAPSAEDLQPPEISYFSDSTDSAPSRPWSRSRRVKFNSLIPPGMRSGHNSKLYPVNSSRFGAKSSPDLSPTSSVFNHTRQRSITPSTTSISKPTFVSTSSPVSLGRAAYPFQDQRFKRAWRHTFNEPRRSSRSTKDGGSKPSKSPQRRMTTGDQQHAWPQLPIRAASKLYEDSDFVKIDLGRGTDDRM